MSFRGRRALRLSLTTINPPPPARPPLERKDAMKLLVLAILFFSVATCATFSTNPRRSIKGRAARRSEGADEVHNVPVASGTPQFSEGPRRSILGLPLGSCIGSSIGSGRCVRFADENETVYCSCAIGHSHYWKQTHGIISI
jgi:hypothetical protein